MTEEALRQAEESLAAMYRARLSAYDEGQRDALAGSLKRFDALADHSVTWSEIRAAIKGDSDE
jgi:hypothetical protein